MRSWATGKRRTLAGEGDPCRCAKRACIRAREERDAAFEIAAAAAAQLHELQAELAARAAQIGAGEGEQLGAAALQQAALAALDGREECVVRAWIVDPFITLTNEPRYPRLAPATPLPPLSRPLRRILGPATAPLLDPMPFVCRVSGF